MSFYLSCQHGYIASPKELGYLYQVDSSRPVPCRITSCRLPPFWPLSGPCCRQGRVHECMYLCSEARSQQSLAGMHGRVGAGTCIFDFEQESSYSVVDSRDGCCRSCTRRILSVWSLHCALADDDTQVNLPSFSFFPSPLSNPPPLFPEALILCPSEIPCLSLSFLMELPMQSVAPPPHG